MTKQKDTIYNFTVIGNGHVLTKYLLPVSSETEYFQIHRIISRAEYKNFMSSLLSNPDYPKYRKLDLEKIIYQKTSGTVLDIIKKINQTSIPNEIILIATSPHTHFEILKKILTKTNKKVYLEKPAVTNLKDFKQLIQLLRKYKNRVYLAEQYVYGRAPILLEAYKKYKKKLGKVNSIKLYLEEGQKYFEAEQKWTANIEEQGQKYFNLNRTGFTDVGPELDLGVHLLGILFKLLGENTNYKIINVSNHKNFLKNYGVEVELIFTPKNKPPIKIFLYCGKRKGQNKRWFKIICRNGELTQNFTSGISQDPVVIKINNKEKQIAKYPKNYHYFTAQISDFLSWIENPQDQNFVIRALECALKIKEKRLKNQQQDTQTKKLKLVAMIPARMGSKRLKNKNIREMAGKPMIYYAIKAAIDADIFDEIYVNSESDSIGAIGIKLGVNFYKRNPKLAQDNVNNEEFVYDFLQNIKTDYLFMIHSNKPLITSEEIKKFVKTMLKDKVDTMFSVEELRKQVFFKNKPVNFDINKPSLRTWMIEPAHAIQWTITGWKTKTFSKNYRKRGYAVHSGKIGLFPISDYAKISVDYEKDFILAEQIMKTKLNQKKKALKGLVSQYRDKMTRILDSLDLEKIQKIIKLLVNTYKKGGQIFVVGNGGSAATASHFAADVSQNTTRREKGRANVFCLNDSIAKITAIANDLGYENIFKEQLYNLLNKNDVLIVITGSGNSPNA